MGATILARPTIERRTAMREASSERMSVTTGTQVDERSAWAAVIARDAEHDGQFVFAVTTTGVYCRPSCAARRPLRANVRFFASPDGAESAGFRACRRCAPRDPLGPGASLRAAVGKARAYLDDHADERVTLARLAEAAGISAAHLQRSFKRLVGVSPASYADARRLERLKGSLQRGDTVSRATYEAGYGSGSRVYERAAPQLGMSPAAYRQRGRGMHVRYTIVSSPLGRLLVAATDQGISRVALGDDDAVLDSALRAEFEQATIERDDAALAGEVAQVLAHLDGAPASDLPLDVRATLFQRQVWDALRRIPRGSTQSYAEVARSLGRPTAARAVARACASNPVAVLVPCHRVVRGDGEMGGYRWGVERKRALLELEKGAEGEGSVER